MRTLTCTLGLTPDQQRIHDSILYDARRRISLIGCAGVGKTRLLAAIAISLGREYGFGAVQIVCPTHRAARQAESALSALGVANPEAGTIHRFLGLRLVRDLDTGKESYQPDPLNPPQVKPELRFLICEEVSMWSTELYDMTSCLARESGTQLLFVGDPCQLPPPDSAVLCPAFDLPGYALTEVLRHDGAILDLATETRRLGVGRARFAAAEGDSSRVVTYRYFQFEHAAVEAACRSQDVRILCYTNRNVMRLNRQVRCRRYGPDAPQYVVGEHLVSHRAIPNPMGGSPLVNSTTEMDVLAAELAEVRVMRTTWQAWQLTCRTERGGRVMFHALRDSEVPTYRKLLREIAAKAKDADGQPRRDLWREYFAHRDAFGHVEHASCLTIHKSQGGTYPMVFLHPDVDLPGRNGPTALQNRLAYVGITRAAEELHVVGDR